MSDEVNVTFNHKYTETLNEKYYQVKAIDTIIDTGGSFTVGLDAYHVGVGLGVYFPVELNNMINYYCYFKYHSDDTNIQYRDWAIKELLGTKQYQKLVDSNNPIEMVNVDLYQYVHNVLYMFEDE